MDRANRAFLLGLAGLAAAGCPSETDSTDTEGNGSSETAGSGDEGSSNPIGTTGATPGDETNGDDGDTGATPADTETGADGETGSADHSGSETTGGTAGNTPVEACATYYALYDECNPKYAGYELCDETFAELQDDALCAGLLGDYYGCLSGLDCRTLDTLEGFPCRDVFEAINDQCDLGFGPCQVGMGGGDLDGTFCDVQFANCVDDNVYRVDCMTAEATVECTCQTNGADAGAFTLMTTEAFCDGADVAAALVADCGWPEGLAATLD